MKIIGLTIISCRSYYRCVFGAFVWVYTVRVENVPCYVSQIEWGQAPLCKVCTPLHVLKLVNKRKFKLGNKRRK